MAKLRQVSGATKVNEMWVVRQGVNEESKDPRVLSTRDIMKASWGDLCRSPDLELGGIQTHVSKGLDWGQQ